MPRHGNHRAPAAASLAGVPGKNIAANEVFVVVHEFN
jgi:hypothetical protein